MEAPRRVGDILERGNAGEHEKGPGWRRVQVNKSVKVHATRDTKQGNTARR